MSEAEFIEQILNAPGEEGPLLVFADWLEESGDPRAELIRLQHALRSLNLPDREQTEGRMIQLVDQIGPPLALKMTTCLEQEMVLIHPGEFLMGASTERDDKDVRHKVSITEPFFLAEHPVTQAEFVAVIGENPTIFAEGEPDWPVDTVSWYEAVNFCNRLSELEEEDPYYEIRTRPLLGPQVTILGGTGYRLPTEAEWEYACRAGTSSTWFFGNDPARLAKFAWIEANSEGRPHPVKSLRFNPWGLYDLYGNVSEWCWDWWGPYLLRPATNPTGRESGRSKVLRGGCAENSARRINSAQREHRRPHYRRGTIGFRIAKTT